MLTSVKIEHLKSSIKNSEFRFRLIAVPFVKNSKIQDRKIREKKFKWLELDGLHLFLHTNENFEVRKPLEGQMSSPSEIRTCMQLENI